MHWLAGVGAVPAGIDVQVPAVPDSAQLWQVAEQPVLQQTPCSQ